MKLKNMLMSKSLFCFLGIVWGIVGASMAQPQKANQEKFPAPIYLKEFNLMIYPKKNPDTISETLNDSTRIKIYLASPKGASTFVAFDLQNRVRIVGGYNKTDVVSKRYVSTLDRSGNEIRILSDFYKAIPAGDWIYYSKDGSLIKTIHCGIKK